MSAMDDRTPPVPAPAPRTPSVPPPPSELSAALPDISTGEIAVADDERATNPRGYPPVQGGETQVLVSRQTPVAPPVVPLDARAVAAPPEGASGGMRIVRRKIRKIGADAEAAAEAAVVPEVPAVPAARGMPLAVTEAVAPEVAPDPLGSSGVDPFSQTAPERLSAPSEEVAELDAEALQTGEFEAGALDDEPTREMRAVGPAPDAVDPERAAVAARLPEVFARPPSIPPPPPKPPAPPAPPLPVTVVAPVLVEAPPSPAAREEDHVEISLEDLGAEGPSDPSLALLDFIAELPDDAKEGDAQKSSVMRGSSLPPPPPSAARGLKSPATPSSLRTTVASTRGRRRLWWEDLFNDDYFRTMAPSTAAQVQREAEWIDHALGVEHGASVLDVGCGAGRQAGALAQRGYKVLGIDYSPAMLSRAADNVRDLPQKPEFVQGDMAAMEFDGRFDAAYCVGTSFGYFDDERNVEVIRRIHRALKPHGTFLLEVLNRDHAIQRQPGMSWYEGDGCLCMEETAFNYITSRLNVKRTMIFDDGRQRELEYGVRLFSLHELGQMLHQTGFRVMEVSGHPRTPRAFFGPSSRQLIILAQKRAQEEVLPGLDG